MSEMLQNPFISKRTKYDFNDETFEFTPRNLKMHFNNVYIFCKFNNNVDYENILQGNLDYNNFKNIIKMFTLYETDISLIYNKVFNPNIIIIDSDLIKESNYFGYHLPEKILLLPIFNISFLHIQNHIDNITNNLNTFEKFYNELIIKNSLNYEYSGKEIYNISKLINNLEIDNYWENKGNCNININKEFNKRMFEYVSIDNKKSTIISSAMTKINKTVDYFDDLIDYKINNLIKKEDITTYNNKYFYSKNGSGYSNNEINSLFEYFENMYNILEQPYENHVSKIKDIIYNLYNKLLKSKEYCHHIINNKKMLDNIFINELFSDIKHGENHMQQFLYNFKYAWTRFYMDEKAKEGYLKTTDEIVFDIDTANKLPLFLPKTYQNNSNPYIVIPINKNFLKNNIYGIDYTTYVDSPANMLGIVDLKTFKEKMNIFISGSELFDIFSGINFKENKIAITGSIMTACLQKNNPLRFKYDNDYRYYSEYYPNSDVDVMVKTKEINEFLTITKKIYNKMRESIKIYFEYLYIDLEYNKNIYVYITKNFIEKNLSSFDYYYVKNNINSNEIIELILPFIENEHTKYLNSLNLDEDKLAIVNKFDKSKINIIMYENQKENYNDITIRFNLKARIKSKYLSRELELFMITGDDFMNVVSKFHLPCVRAFYDGDTVYMTPSCITSYMTMINMHYTYFSGASSPMEIINKYRMRGFGILLNNKEIGELFKYSCDTEFWRNLYGFTDISNINSNMRKFINYIRLDSPFFEPRKTNFAFYIDDNYVEDTYKSKKQINNYKFIFYFNKKKYEI